MRDESASSHVAPQWFDETASGAKCIERSYVYPQLPLCLAPEPANSIQPPSHHIAIANVPHWNGSLLVHYSVSPLPDEEHSHGKRQRKGIKEVDSDGSWKGHARCVLGKESKNLAHGSMTHLLVLSKTGQFSTSLGGLTQCSTQAGNCFVTCSARSHSCCGATKSHVTLPQRTLHSHSPQDRYYSMNAASLIDCTLRRYRF